MAVMTPREARRLRGVTSQHMASVLGISYKSYNRRERGRNQWKAAEEKRFLQELHFNKMQVDFTKAGPLDRPPRNLENKHADLQDE